MNIRNYQKYLEKFFKKSLILLNNIKVLFVLANCWKAATYSSATFKEAAFIPFYSRKNVVCNVKEESYDAVTLFSSAADKSSKLLALA